MIRENQQLFNILNVILDIVIVVLSVTIIQTDMFAQVTNLQFSLSYDTSLTLFAIVLPTYLLLFSFFKLYAPQRTSKSIFSESIKIIQANFVEFLLLTFIKTVYIVDIPIENFIVILLIVNMILAVIERAIIRMILRFMRGQGFNIKYILIIGAGEVGEKLANTIKKNKYLGYRIIGFLDDNITEDVAGIKIIGQTKDIETLLSKNVIDRVLVSISPRHHQTLQKTIDICEKSGVRADIVPDYYRYITSKPTMEIIDNIPLISVRSVPLDITYNKYSKRIFDILFVTVTSIIFSPLLIIIAILIKVTSKGPIFYSQTRVGTNGKHFKIYKFRSMTTENEYIDEIKWTQKNDPRITKIGKIIRKTSIDELPQFYNILKGDMSLIGPRPERPYFVNKFKESIPKYMIKHHVRPGMTGWAQVNGYRGNTSIKSRIDYDTYYVENWSMTLDAKIFLKTLPALLNDKNAY